MYLVYRLENEIRKVGVRGAEDALDELGNQVAKPRAEVERDEQ